MDTFTRDSFTDQQWGYLTWWYDNHLLRKQILKGKCLCSKPQGKRMIFDPDCHLYVRFLLEHRKARR